MREPGWHGHMAGCVTAFTQLEVIRMEVIQAKVNSRLLSKASRLFTGSLTGRIIEILQNARRAGATNVDITNRDGQVTVQDNGQGIADFAALLDLGRSGWDQTLESAEDPAGVGIFCLSPRELTIRSGCKRVVITEKAWTGEPVPVQETQDAVTGTTLVFRDDPWIFEAVEKHAVFTGMNVTVDGRPCAHEPFVSQAAVPHPELGCRIEVLKHESLGKWQGEFWHVQCRGNVLVNFHGQVVSLVYGPISESLVYLVDLTGEPTDIRMVLPARIQMIENAALESLKAVLEKEAYRHIQHRGRHQLKFSECVRAKELGIELPEAVPAFTVGLLRGEPDEPVAVTKPQDWPLAKCYRATDECLQKEEHNEANIHLLSALGTFDSPFVVVDISSAYDGYSWARLPTVDRVEVAVGKELVHEYLWCERIVAVESLQITVHTSDGRVFNSSAPMAIRETPKEENKACWSSLDVLVTPAAQEQLVPTDIWYHMGGWSEDGDTYDTQLASFEEQLEAFWAKLVGPGEHFRLKLLDCARSFPMNWLNISIESSGKVWISFKDGTAQMLQPPEISAVP
jgi:hypothetical protein